MKDSQLCYQRGSPVQGRCEPAYHRPPAKLIPVDALRQLNRRADLAGDRWRPGADPSVCGLGMLVCPGRSDPALLLLGWGLPSAFCPCTNAPIRTPSQRSLNDACLWQGAELLLTPFLRRTHQ